jgi:hypothetical protein
MAKPKEFVGHMELFILAKCLDLQVETLSFLDGKI